MTKTQERRSFPKCWRQSFERLNKIRIKMLFDLTRKTAVCDLQANSFRKEVERRMVYRMKKVRIRVKKEIHETFVDHQ